MQTVPRHFKSSDYMYSVIFPIYNEEHCLSQVLQNTLDVLNQTGEPFEILCVDDASTDNTWNIIQDFHARYPHIKGIRFMRNFGHQMGILAGIQHARGNYLSVLDADGQDPPEILPDMFAKCKEGFDVVYAIRKKRKEGFIKRSAYSLFYRLYQHIVPFKVPLDSGDFSVFTRKVGDFIAKRTEKNPFIRGLRSWYGGKQCGFEYERQARLSGRPKYNYLKLFLLAMNASISFSKVPLRIISISGILIASAAFLLSIALIIMKFTVNIPLLGWTSTAVLIIFFGGLNLFVLGIIGEYIGDIFDEVKNRPVYLIDESIGVGDNA